MQSTDQVYEVPYVEKRSVTILAIGDPTEPPAIRAVLEGFDYLVINRWIGSRAELVKTLSGELQTEDTIVISGHGGEEGFLVPDEAPLGPPELAAIGKLAGKTVVSLACLTGTAEFAEAFRTAGVAHYIAPDDFPDFRAALAFTTVLFFLLSSDVNIVEAAERASTFHGETSQFKLLVQRGDATPVDASI